MQIPFPFKWYPMNKYCKEQIRRQDKNSDQEVNQNATCGKTTIEKKNFCFDTVISLYVKKSHENSPPLNNSLFHCNSS